MSYCPTRPNVAVGLLTTNVVVLLTRYSNPNPHQQPEPDRSEVVEQLHRHRRRSVGADRRHDRHDDVVCPNPAQCVSILVATGREAVVDLIQHPFYRRQFYPHRVDGGHRIVIVGGATASRAPLSHRDWEGGSQEWWGGRRECQRQAILPLKVCVISGTSSACSATYVKPFTDCTLENIYREEPCRTALLHTHKGGVMGIVPIQKELQRAKVHKRTDAAVVGRGYGCCLKGGRRGL
jgi:hypothetical protein